MKNSFIICMLLFVTISFAQMPENEKRVIKIFEKVKLDESPEPNYKINECEVYINYDVVTIVSKSNPRIYVLDNYGKNEAVADGITFSIIKAIKFEITPEKVKLGRKTYRLRILLEGGKEANYELVEFIEKT
ncbi:hypothetical protein NTJ12_001517 [Flavobacterium psychrophilum]|nr:hypothetical protein [Flavobacterium psychrophilum]